MKTRFVERALLASLCAAASARGADPTPGYPEPVIHWVVQKGETCETIAKAVYGAPKHVALLGRYTRVRCGGELAEGQTLVIPASPTSLPDARLRSMNPNVEGKPPGGGWAGVSTGAPLYSQHSVQTKQTGRADIEFLDRTRIFLADNTLVVIFGTAARTAVKKNVAPSVELEQGEVKAGLAALRGEPVGVAIKGGGSVSAASKDAVVERKGARTTVAVFDGKAKVENAGKTVEVPTNFGTRFVGAKPPDPPRPLPPAPTWHAGEPELVLAMDGKGALRASWGEVTGAKSYRFEVSRDADFRDLLAREEVTGKVTSFRAEAIPPGSYWVSVRAIDQEDFLGVAAKRRFDVVAARAARGPFTLGDQRVTVSRYTVLELEPRAGDELAIDDGAFGPAPKRLDLGERPIRRLRLRRAGAATLELAVDTQPTEAAVTAAADPASARLRLGATLSGIDARDVPTAVKPVFRVRQAGAVAEIAARVDGLALSAEAPLSVDAGEVRVDLVDGAGFVLGTTAPSVDRPSGPAAPALAVPRVFLVAPLVSLSPLDDAQPLLPTPRDAGAVSVSAGRVAGESVTQGTARASGSLGRVGLDGRVSTEARSQGGGAWAGASLRTYRRGLAELEHGLGLRVGLPMSSAGPAARVEPSTTLAGVGGRWTWLASVGARLRAEDTATRAPTPRAAGFLLGGVSFDPAPALRIGALVDAEVLGARTGASTRARGGAQLGVEAGRAVFVGASARVSPWSDLGPSLSAQLALGLRSF
ncbi:MAG: FecR domain-containing protein [Polyangiaceae bacterium]|nr:FecR domain-containing protein [Polyangiaceae bacterium]